MVTPLVGVGALRFSSRDLAMTLFGTMAMHVSARIPNVSRSLWLDEALARCMLNPQVAIVVATVGQPGQPGQENEVI
jgi:hypothetical protein